MSQTAPKTVILWVHPRSTSTMFECALLQKQDEFRVVHEPMGDAFYFGPERISKRFSAERCATDFPEYKNSDFKKVWLDIVNGDASGKRTFSKDMAQYIFNQSSSEDIKSRPSLGPVEPSNPSLIPDKYLLDPSIIHTFLIRTPKKAIVSYDRLCYPGSETMFEYFDPEEAGYRELRLLFDYLKSKGLNPLLLDSDDVLSNTEATMKLWCDHVHLKFDPSMLEWSEGTREHFKKWPGFHKAAEQSTGINKGLKDDLVIKHEEAKPQALSPKVQACIEENEPIYAYLTQFVTHP